MLKPNTLLAVSGGADSMYMLYQFKDVPGIGVAHVNYHIRPDSNLDEALVRKCCLSLGIRFHSLNVEPVSDVGLEEWARNIRYDYFNKLVKEFGYDYIATAHNANDQAETVLMRQIRGCGIKGLRGILPEIGNIYRPFLHLKKSFIYEECERLSIAYREDSTNTDQKYFRNYIRANKVNEDNIDELCLIASQAYSKYNELLNKANNYIENNVVFKDRSVWIPKNLPNDDLGFIILDVLCSRFNKNIDSKTWKMYHSEDGCCRVFKLSDKLTIDKRKKNYSLLKVA